MKKIKQKIRNFLIYFVYYSGIAVLRFWLLRLRGEPLLRVLAFHEVKDSQKENFQKQLAFLKKRFNIISPDDFLTGSLSKNRTNILLTFDDAFASWLKNVLPVLKKENLSAIFFLQGRGLALSAALQQSGQTIGGHTNSHPRLTKISHNELIFEIGENKKEIIFFAYPYGDKKSFNQKVIEEVKRAGCKYAFTILPGFNTFQTNKFLLHRDSVDPGWALRFLKIWLIGAYDWRGV